MLPPLTDDPFARRRELAVVAELCAAWLRGAGQPGVTDCDEGRGTPPLASLRQSAAAVPKSYPGTEIRGIGVESRTREFFRGGHARRGRGYFFRSL